MTNWVRLMVLVRDIMTSDPIKVGVGDSVSVALGKMKEATVHSVVVTEGDRFAGMLSIPLLMGANIDPTKAKCGSYMFVTATATAEDDVEEAARKLIGSNTRAIPVIENGSIVGVVSESDVATALARHPDWSGMKLSGLMNRHSTTLKPDMTVSEARKAMRAGAGHHVLPVVTEYGKLEGVLTAYDMIEATMKPRSGVSAGDSKERVGEFAVPIAGLLRQPVVTKEEMGLAEAVRQMKEQGAPCVCMVDSENKLLGMLSPRAILRFFRGQKLERLVRCEIVGLDMVDPFVMDDLLREMGTTAEKLRDVVSEFEMLQLRGKEVFKGGKPRYDLIIALRAAGKPQHSVRDSGWDIFKTTVQMLKVLEKLALADKERAKRSGTTTEGHIERLKRFGERRSN